MEFQFNIDDSEIISEIEKKAHSVAVGLIRGWEIQQYIEAAVKKEVRGAIDSMITGILSDSPAMRASIVEKIEKKLTAQINAAMKVKESPL